MGTGPVWVEPRQADAFAGLYAQEIDWAECGPEAGLDAYTVDALEAAGHDLSQIGCAVIEAPFDWDDPENAETIELSIGHIPATGKEPLGTLLGNPGGPGATGVDFMLGIALATSCRTDYADEVEVCPFVDEDSLLAVLAQLDAEPLTASDGTEITGELLQSNLTNALYQSHFERGRTLDTIALALFGDQEAIDDIGSEFADDGSGVDMAMTVVTCHSFPIEPNIPGLLEHIERVGMPRLLGGPAIDDETLAPYTDLSCYTLPESGLDLTDSFSAPDAGPILVIGITGDHATPFQYADVLTKELGNAVLLTLDGQGHSASYSGRSSCVDVAVTEYLLAGDLPAAGTVCGDDAAVAGS